MGFLSDLFPNADASTALGLLGSQMAGGNFAQGLLAANQHLAEAPDRAMARQLRQAQIAETLAQADERKSIAAQRQAELARQAGIQAGLPNIFRQPGLTGGEAVPQTFGGTDVPMFSQPVGAAPMRATPGGFDLQEAFRLRMKPEEIKAYAELPNIGRAEVAREVEEEGPGGAKIKRFYDKFGTRVGGDLNAYVAPVSVNQGDRQTFVKPAPGVSLPVNQSPDSKASNTLGWANYGLSKKRFDMEQNNAVTDAGGPTQAALTKRFGKAGAGYRWKEDGSQEFIPGGPADLKSQATTAGQGTVDGVVADLRDRYRQLHEGGGITSTDNGVLGNTSAWASSSAGGQAAGRLFGTQNQSARNSIAMSRPLLLQAIMKATGMSAKQMDSNAELKLYLATATDPTLDLEANMAALDRIEMLYGSGNRKGAEPPTAPKAASTAATFSDPSKESRYQEWKRSMGK
jgi:hypothetical protein